MILVDVRKDDPSRVWSMGAEIAVSESVVRTFVILDGGSDDRAVRLSTLLECLNGHFFVTARHFCCHSSYSFVVDLLRIP